MTTGSGLADTRSKSRRDLVWVVVGVLLFWVVSITFELSERLAAWLRPWERFQLDELPGVLLFLAAALAWYAWRRVAEVRRQLVLRQAAEAKLSVALTENRRLSLSHVQVQEAERKQLARELHDELGQHLNAMKVDAVALRNWTEGKSEDMHGAALAILQSADHVHDTLRDMLRRLRPVGLDELGLGAALEHLLANWQARNPDTQVALEVAGDIESLGENENMTVYRLVQEALSNVARHARASKVVVKLTRQAEIELLVRDNGSGARANANMSGLGLIGMRERVEAVGGSIRTHSREGLGFEIYARLPARTVS